MLARPRKLVGFHFGSFPERVRINPDPVQVGRHWIRVPAPARLTGWDVAHPELLPVVSGTRGCAGSFPPARHLLHPPPSPLPKNSVVPLAEELCLEGAQGAVALALPLSPALCLVSPLQIFPIQSPGRSQNHAGFVKQQGNVWDKAPSFEDVRVTLPGPSVLARMGLKLAPKSTAQLIAHLFHRWVNN